MSPPDWIGAGCPDIGADGLNSAVTSGTHENPLDLIRSCNGLPLSRTSSCLFMNSGTKSIFYSAEHHTGEAQVAQVSAGGHSVG